MADTAGSLLCSGWKDSRIQCGVWKEHRTEGSGFSCPERVRLWPLTELPLTYMYHEVTEIRRAVNIKLFLRAVSPT